MTTEEMREDVSVLNQPTRHRIYVELKEAGEKGRYINELAQHLDIDRQLIAFHLLQLQKHELVTNKYRILKQPTSKGKAANFFILTEKAHRAAEKIREELEEP